MTNPPALLRNPAFRNLVAGRTISVLGNGVAPIALAFAVLDLTGSVRDLGLVVGARSLTNGAFLLFGGVLADRLPRQMIMVVSSVLAGLSQGVIAFLVLHHSATVPLLMVLGAVNGIVAAMSQPAAAAVLQQTIAPAQRTRGNAINRLAINAAQIVGISLGGLLVAGIGPGWGLVVDAASFGLAAILFALVRVPRVRITRDHASSPWHELREGWTEFASRTWVWVVVLGFMFFNMAEVAALSVLGPAVADETFGRPAWGFFLAAEAVGTVLGGLLAMRLRIRRLLLVGVACCLGPAAMLLVLGGYPHIAVLIPVAVVAGLAIEQFGVAWEVSMQEHIPQEKLARVYSYDMLGSILAIPVGQVAAGPLALAFGAPVALIACGVVALVAVIGMLASASVRRLEHDPVPPAAVDLEPVPDIVHSGH